MKERDCEKCERTLKKKEAMICMECFDEMIGKSEGSDEEIEDQYIDERGEQ